MRIHVVHFDSTRSLARAFDRLLASPDVESCMVESETRRIRFLAPQPVAEEILDRIYQDRGMVWCSVHGFSGSSSR